MPTTADKLERNRWGHGRVWKPGAEESTWYRRASHVAGSLSDKSAITQWTVNNTALGFASSPTLGAKYLRAKSYQEKIDIVDEAQDVAGANDAANKGTFLHDLSERHDLARYELGAVPTEYQGWLQSYAGAVERAGLTVHSSEQLVVVDELDLVGSFDRIWKTQDGRLLVGDLKTGKHARRFPHSIAIQIALYAHGLLYDPETHERFELGDVSQTSGLLIHSPLQGETRIYEIDITQAWNWALETKSIAAWNKSQLLTDWK
jgi:hypothetical protein